MKIVQLSRLPTHLVHLRPKLFQPLDLVQFQTNLPPSPNDNQSIKTKQNLRMTIMLSDLSVRLAFIFSISLLILSGFLLTSFHLAEVSQSAFTWLYTLVCAVIENDHEISFTYNHLDFQYSFCNQRILFVQFENMNKLWNNKRTVHVNERNQNNKKQVTAYSN